MCDVQCAVTATFQQLSVFVVQPTGLTQEGTKDRRGRMSLDQKRMKLPDRPKVVWKPHFSSRASGSIVPTTPLFTWMLRRSFSRSMPKLIGNSPAPKLDCLPITSVCAPTVAKGDQR